MIKYYIYNAKNEGKNYFVPDKGMLLFARDNYNPDAHEYTGVCVEADTLKEAIAAYEQPSKGDVYLADEPKVTKMKAILHRYAKKQSDRQGYYNAVDQLEFSLQALHILMHQVSNLGAGVTKDVTASQLYEEIKRRIINDLQHKRFNDGDSFGGEAIGT